MLTKKNSAISRLKILNKKKQRDAADKNKKIFEDPRETKTIFSKISEEIFYKLSKDKYKKTSAYDYMTDDLYINRVVQKGDQENKNKFNSFLERNNEFFNKKKLRLNEKITKISEETNSNLYAIPNKKVFNKDELRNPEQFFDDQKNFVLQKQQYVDGQREEKVKKNMLESKNFIPEINKNSKSIAEKKINDKTEVFERLHNQRNNKEKQQILNEIVSNVNSNNGNNSNNADEKENKLLHENNNNKIDSNVKPHNGNNNIITNNANKNNRTKLLTQNKQGFNGNNHKHAKVAMRLKCVVKKLKSPMQSHSNKLHDDAKKLQAKLEEKAKQLYKTEALDLQCKRTKLMNIEKFIKSFNKNLMRVIKEKTFRDQNNDYENNETTPPKSAKNRTKYCKNCRLDFTDYCRLLRNLGFVKNSFETLKAHLESGELENNENQQQELLNSDKKPDLKELNEKLINPSKKPKLVQKLIKIEALLVLDSWKVLLSKAPQQSKQAKIDEIFEVDHVDSNDILVFLCVVQGFLKGNLNRVITQEEQEKEMLQIKANKIVIYDEISSKNNKKPNANKNSKEPDERLKSLEKTNNLKASLNFNNYNNSHHHNNNENSDLIKKRKNSFLCDDEDNLANKPDLDALIPPNGEFNKFKRLKSKDSVNMFLKKSTSESKFSFSFNIFIDRVSFRK